jgi:alpha 1,3-glucosidase
MVQFDLKLGAQSIGIDFTFPGSKNVYGIPEHASSFSLKSTNVNGNGYSEPYRLYNLDVFEYILDSPMALYGSIPFLLSHSLDATVAVAFLNPSEMWVDIEKTTVNFIVTLVP